MTVGLIDTGCANLASVRFALERAGIEFSGDQAKAETHASLRGVELADGTFVRLLRAQ